ncbi:MAG: bifunctional ornithine acetyltransferase/N-acetylglutamate synthase, partial [Bacillota bacterium]|nr:bifunctional ornithine acetyltransferase/N-acetylglutamate synthase [Bacillota bacterium]
MSYKYISGGVTAPIGFTAAGLCCGIKPSNTSKRDVALIVADALCNTAAVFTKNIVKSYAIAVTKEHIANGKAQAVIANSGNANACTSGGQIKAKQMAELAAQELNISANDVIIASTGVIGQPLPIEPIQNNIKKLVSVLSKEGGTDAAEAIMTTDTIKKECAVETTIGGKTVKIGGIAKGSGMIHINMGTMLSFVTTDCAISSEMLLKALKEAVDVSYNMVSVDGDMSTNDTLAIMASGHAKN